MGPQCVWEREREERGRREEDTTKIEAGGGGGCREKEREWECDDSRPKGKRRAGRRQRRTELRRQSEKDARGRESQVVSHCDLRVAGNGNDVSPPQRMSASSRLCYHRGFQNRRSLQDFPRGALAAVVPAASVAGRVRHAQALHDADLGDDLDAHHGGEAEGGGVLRRHRRAAQAHRGRGRCQRATQGQWIGCNCRFRKTVRVVEGLARLACCSSIRFRACTNKVTRDQIWISLAPIGTLHSCCNLQMSLNITPVLYVL